MASVIIEDTVQVRLLWRMDNTPWAVNVLAFQVGGGYTANQASADAIRTAVNTAFNGPAGIKANIHTTWNLAEIGLRDLRVANQPEYRSVLPGGGGAGAGDRLAPTQTAKVMLRTALAGKRYRGAVFVPGWSEAGNTTAGQMAGTVTASSRLFVQAIGAGLSPLGLTHAVASRTNGTSQPVVTYASLNSIWSTQRKRREALAAF